MPNFHHNHDLGSFVPYGHFDVWSILRPRRASWSRLPTTHYAPTPRSHVIPSRNDNIKTKTLQRLVQVPNTIEDNRHQGTPIGRKMTRLILPTVSESDEFFNNGFVIVQERRSVTSPLRRARMGKHQPHRDKKCQRAATPMRPPQQSNPTLWCPKDNNDEDGANGKPRRNRRSGSHRRVNKSNTDREKTLTILTKNHIIETTQHTKCQSDRTPRPPIRTLPSLYFS